MIFQSVVEWLDIGFAWTKNNISKPLFSPKKLRPYTYSELRYLQTKMGCMKKEMHITLLSKPQPNLDTMVGFDKKITLQIPPQQKLNVSNISAVIDTILTKLSPDEIFPL